MLPVPVELAELRQEARFLGQRISIVERSWQAQKYRREVLEEENIRLKRENEQLKDRLRKEHQRLEEELNKVKRERDTYKDMVFKAKKHLPSQTEDDRQPKRYRGGQIGHWGKSRPKPDHIDQTVAAY